ncbi:MAG TPA: hypothetical protein VHU24_11255 [Solirubrobacterales bacterium]|nr:hypothetical protein [Solirubrobacterales bacterium]
MTVDRAPASLLPATAKRFRRLRLALCLAPLMVALSPSIGSASAAACSASEFVGDPTPPLFPSCFEGQDGDMADSDGAAGPGIDWQNVVGLPATTVLSDQTGSSDDTFEAGSKEEIPSGWGLSLSPASPASDIFDAASNPDQASADVFANLGTLLKAANGDIHASFELNQVGPGTAANPTYRTVPLGTSQVPLPARTTGDVLLSFDSVGGIATVGLCTWRSDQSDPSVSGYYDSGQWYLLDGTALDNTNDKQCTKLNGTTPSAQGAVNAATIASAQDFLASSDVSAGNFGELSVDLTSALAPVLSGQCRSFQSWWMRTRSSGQVSSNPEDFIGPRPVTISNCPVSHTLAVAPAGTGSGVVTSSPSGIDCGATCSHSFDQGTAITLTATPAAGSSFAGWSGGGCSGTATACHVTLNANTSVSATFSPPPKNTLTVVKGGSGAGKVTSSPAGISCGATCSSGFDPGSSVTLNASASAGSTFAGWGGACSGSGACTVTMSAAKSVTATFKAVPGAPNTKIGRAKVDSSAGKATFKFSASGQSTGFRCALVNKHKKPKFKSCKSPKTYKKLKPGKYTFEVRAVGRGGPDPSPAKTKFKIKK